MSSLSQTSAPIEEAKLDPPAKRQKMKSPYPTWFHFPAAALYIALFAIPTFASLYFSLTRWTLFEVEFIG
ncbi:MAG TPA: hypothetical protein VLQ67_02805, partial [Arachnia sp.]|nr:hypothetical protein [Arachnia sp.]